MNWQSSDPATQGMDAAALAGIDAYVAARFPTVRGVTIARHGAVVFERHYGRRVGWPWRRSAPDALVNVKSVTKSIVSALVGIALRDGLLASLDQRVAEMLPEELATQPDERKRGITLGHLLTMRSGIQWLENDPASMNPLRASGNWVRHALALPLVAAPGARFTYSTLDAHLLSAILTRVSGMSALDYANQQLFGPLGIHATRWTADRQGINIGGSELFLRPREMLALGTLYLQQGQWRDRQVVPADYVATSTHMYTPPEETGIVPDGYGYLWWIGSAAGHASFHALGYGGQQIYVVPDLDLLIVTTAHWKVPLARGLIWPASEIAARFAVPAVARETR